MTLTENSTPEQVQAAWADRLDANPGRQGMDMLAPTTGTRCCLGELCDMAVEAGIIEDYATGDSTLAEYGPVQRWAGLSTPEGVFHDGALTTLNDTGSTWPQIAAVIRERPSGLFS